MKCAWAKCRHIIPVKERKEAIEIFENMHWRCFHMVYEHLTAENVRCSDPSCPIKEEKVDGRT